MYLATYSRLTFFSIAVPVFCVETRRLLFLFFFIFVLCVITPSSFPSFFKLLKISDYKPSFLSNNKKTETTNKNE